MHQLQVIVSDTIFSFSAAGLFHRKRVGAREHSRSPHDSPDTRRRAGEVSRDASRDAVRLPAPLPPEDIRKRRTISDVTPMLQDKVVRNPMFGISCTGNRPGLGVKNRDFGEVCFACAFALGRFLLK